MIDLFLQGKQLTRFPVLKTKQHETYKAKSLNATIKLQDLKQKLLIVLLPCWCEIFAQQLRKKSNKPIKTNGIKL